MRCLPQRGVFDGHHVSALRTTSPDVTSTGRRMRGCIIIVIGIILFIVLMVAISNGFTLFPWMR